MKSSPVQWLLKLGWVALTVGLLLWIGPWLNSGLIINQYWYSLLLLMGISVILAVSLNLINGFCGQFSIGHAGFMAIGGYLSTYFTLNAIKGSAAEMGFAQQSVWILAALAIAAVTAGIAGLLVGIPSLRLRGDYLAIVTLGFSEIIRVLIINTKALGEAAGLYDIPPLSNFFWIWLVATGTIGLSRNLFVSSHGRAVLAVREDEIAAEALGVPTTKYKVLIFALSSALAGMGGCLQAHHELSISPDVFTFEKSIVIIVMIILGGLGSTTGAVLGAILVTLLPEALRFIPEARLGAVTINWQEWRMVIYSLFLILLMLTRPKGLLGGLELSWAGFRKIGGRRSDRTKGPNVPRDEDKAADSQQGELL